MEKYAYKDSLPHGKWIGYYKDGETKHVKRFEDGKKQGKWQYYTELGDVHTLELFENDKGLDGQWTIVFQCVSNNLCSYSNLVPVWQDMLV